MGDAEEAAAMLTAVGFRYNKRYGLLGSRETGARD